MATKPHVLITGAAGLVGGIVRQHWGDRYRLRLADIQPVSDLADHEESIKLDIRDLEAFTEACRDIDVVLHLAADRSPSADFYETLIDLNLIGCYNGFEAARRVVFASSINAVLGYRGSSAVPWDVPIFPQNVYGATKCFGEALGQPAV